MPVLNSDGGSNSVSSTSKNCEYFLLEICKPLRCKASEAKISKLKPPDKKHRKLRFSMLFCCKNAENGASQNVSQALSHTVTHTRKCADRFKEYQRGGLSPLRYFASFFCLHHLRHEASHRLCGFVLLLPCGVGVGSQGKACIIVPQHTADRFHVDTVL